MHEQSGQMLQGPALRYLHFDTKKETKRNKERRAREREREREKERVRGGQR